MKRPGPQGIKLRIGERTDNGDLVIGRFLEGQQVAFVAQENHRFRRSDTGLDAVLGSGLNFRSARFIDIWAIKEAEAELHLENRADSFVQLSDTDAALPQGCRQPLI